VFFSFLGHYLRRKRSRIKACRLFDSGMQINTAAATLCGLLLCRLFLKDTAILTAGIR
jgi:hypothetical protein